MLPEKTRDGATTTKSTSGKPTSLPSVDEAVEAAWEQVGGGAAEESATDDEDEREDETTDPDGSDETTDDGADTESDEGDADAGEGETEEEGESDMLSADDFDDLKPGQQINVPLKSVRPEDRDYVRRVKANLSRAFQAASERRRNGDDESTERTPEKKQEKTYTDDELFEMAQDGPEGFKRAQQIYLDQNIDSALERRGIKAPSEQEVHSTLVDRAIEISVKNGYPELNDAKFRLDVANQLRGNDVTARRFNRALKSGDPEMLAPVIEVAVERVKADRYKRTEAMRAKTKTAKETETARERGSVAATSTTRSSTAAKPRPTTVEGSVEAAIKSVGGNPFK